MSAKRERGPIFWCVTGLLLLTILILCVAEIARWAVELATIKAADISNKDALDLAAQQEMAFWAKLMLIASVASLVATIGGAVLVWQSLRLTREAISNDREIGHAQARAYIGVELWLKKNPDNNSGNDYIIECIIKNTGQTPAYDLNIKCFSNIFGEDIFVKKEHTIFLSSIGGGAENIIRTDFFTYQELTIMSWGCGKYYSDIDISYKDVFGRSDLLMIYRGYISRVDPIFEDKPVRLTHRQAYHDEGRAVGTEK